MDTNNVSKNNKLRHYILASALMLSTCTAFASKIPDSFDLETISCKLLNKDQSERVSYTLGQREPIYNITADADASPLQFIVRTDNFHPYKKQLLLSPYPVNHQHSYFVQRDNRQITALAEYPSNSEDARPIWYAQRVKEILRLPEIEGTPDWVWTFAMGAHSGKLYYSCKTVVETRLVSDIENHLPQ